MKKIRVLMVADYPLGGKKIDGGVQAVTAYIVQGLLKTPGIELFIVRFRNKLDAPELIREGPLTIYQLPRANKGTITRFRDDLKLFKHYVDQIKPDIIHSQGALSEGYLTVKSSVPSVVTFHGIINEDAKYKPTLKERLRFKLISYLAEDYCVKNSQHNILISPYVSRYFGSRLKGDTRLIANPIKPDFFDLNQGEAASENRILYAGKIIQRKGIIDLIHALGKLDTSLNYQVRLAGAQDDKPYIDQINHYISSYGLEKKVIFLGHLNEEQVLDEYSKASILVLPSYQETAPMVVQQAMAARVPVIATHICGVPDQLNHGELGRLFEAGDAAMLAKHLNELITQPETRKEIAEQAYQKALTEYHVDAVVDKTVNYYRHILD